jgi:hypothetical protein
MTCGGWPPFFSFHKNKSLSDSRSDFSYSHKVLNFFSFLFALVDGKGGGGWTPGALHHWGHSVSSDRRFVRHASSSFFLDFFFSPFDWKKKINNKWYQNQQTTEVNDERCIFLLLLVHFYLSPGDSSAGKILEIDLFTSFYRNSNLWSKQNHISQLGCCCPIHWCSLGGHSNASLVALLDRDTQR